LKKSGVAYNLKEWWNKLHPLWVQLPTEEWLSRNSNGASANIVLKKYVRPKSVVNVVKPPSKPQVSR